MTRLLPWIFSTSPCVCEPCVCLQPRNFMLIVILSMQFLCFVHACIHLWWRHRPHPPTVYSISKRMEPYHAILEIANKLPEEHDHINLARHLRRIYDMSNPR